MNTLGTGRVALRVALAQRSTELLDTLRTWPWADTVRTLRERFREDHLGLTAGSLTFTTLIAMVPLLTVMLAVFSAFPMFASFQLALQTYFLQSLVPDNIATPVLRSLTQFAGMASKLGGLGLALLVVTALALVLTIDRTLNALWRVRTQRPLGQRLLVYWTALTLGPLALGVSLSFTSYALSASKGLVSALPGGLSLLLNSLEFGLLALATAALFRYVPNTSVRWRHAWAGALFVAVGFEAAKKVLAWYVVSVPTYSMVYGAFATVPILLLWVYMGWVIVLLGAVIAAYAPSLQMQTVRRAAVPGYLFDLALAVLRSLADARAQPGHGLTLAALAEGLRVDPLQLEPVIEVLSRIDWAQRLAEGGKARWVLLCDPASTLLAPLVAQTLLAPSAASSGFRRAAGLDSMLLAQALDG